MLGDADAGDMIMDGMVGSATGMSSWSGDDECDERCARERGLKVALRGDADGVRRVRDMAEMRGSGASESSERDGLARASLSPVSVTRGDLERGDVGADCLTSGTSQRGRALLTRMVCVESDGRAGRVPGRLMRRV